MRLTIDTNILGAARVLHIAKQRGHDVRLVSVSHREVERTSFEREAANHATVVETAVWDEFRWDEAVWADNDPTACLEQALGIIAGYSFPPIGMRDVLSAGHRRQLRDAIIFCTHVRERRDLFVTDDRKGFHNGGRRETLQAQFATWVVTSAEYVAEFDVQAAR